MSHLKPDVNTNDHIEGNQKAAVTFVEYGDYECPACGDAYPMIKAIQEQMGDKMRFIFRNFPLNQAHPHAKGAALAAEAAGKQGKFWEMHDLLYENQEQLEAADLAGYAEELGLDLEKFQSDFADQTLSQKIQSDFSSGARSGVNGTPSFYINGEKYEGPYEAGALLETIKNAH